MTFAKSLGFWALSPCAKSKQPPFLWSDSSSGQTYVRIVQAAQQDSPMTNASACGSHIRGATATAVYRHLQAADPGVIPVQEGRSIRAFEDGASLCLGKIKLGKPIQGGGKFPFYKTLLTSCQNRWCLTLWAQSEYVIFWLPVFLCPVRRPQFIRMLA